MPRRFTMGTLVTRCQQHADKVGDDHIETAEWKSRISLKYGELYGLIANTGCRYFETKATITATGAASYAEPADHRTSIGMDLVRADGTRRELPKLEIQERNILAGRTGEAFFFQHVDDLLVLHPKPSSGTYEYLYIPQATDLSAYADAGVVDVANEDGEAMLIWGTAASALSKSESELRFALEQERLAAARLKDWAIERFLTQATRRVITDVREITECYWNPARWVPA